MRHFGVGIMAFLITISAVAAVSASDSLLVPDGQPAAFTEIWAYLMSGEESTLSPTMPISDIGYFGAGLNNFGKLTGVPKRSNLAAYQGRVHLVVAEVSNQALTHFSLDPSFPMRGELIEDIVTASEPFDGVQIDFELVPARDKEYFISFLASIKERIGSKSLSVALPARVKAVDDAYDYPTIARIADRIIIMAYDEHWSGSSPGAIASLNWCKRVSDYALLQIGKDKVVMGIPFYGRAWGETTLSKAYRFSGLSRLIAEHGVTEISRSEGIPSFEYTQPVKVQVFYEDANSIFARASMYRNSAVRGISFWRLGQEDPAVWPLLSIAEPVSNTAAQP